MSIVIVTFQNGKLTPPKGYRLSKAAQGHTFAVNSIYKSRQFRVNPDNYRFLEKIPANVV
jgi:hypothetical protein